MEPFSDTFVSRGFVPALGLGLGMGWAHVQEELIAEKAQKEPSEDIQKDPPIYLL